MGKLYYIRDEDNQNIIVGYYFDCPAESCTGHTLFVKPFKSVIGSSWEFNEDLNKPTFRPSVLTKRYTYDGLEEVCHFFVTEGNIYYLNDCTHNLAGQTIEMEEVELL